MTSWFSQFLKIENTKRIFSNEPWDVIFQNEVVNQSSEELPDLRPWIDNESDLYEELPSQCEHPYE